VSTGSRKTPFVEVVKSFVADAETRSVAERSEIAVAFYDAINQVYEKLVFGVEKPSLKAMNEFLRVQAGVKLSGEEIVVHTKAVQYCRKMLGGQTYFKNDEGDLVACTLSTKSIRANEIAFFVRELGEGSRHLSSRKEFPKLEVR